MNQKKPITKALWKLCLIAALFVCIVTAGCAGKNQTRGESPAAVTALATEAVTPDTGEETAYTTEAASEYDSTESTDDPDINGIYTSKDDVALYLHVYGKLPRNFITKKEARDLGWSRGSLEPYAPDKCIGGDEFGNYEGALPEGNYHECDIDTLGSEKRGAKRIVYSDDGRIYYTDDHYATFTQLYGEEQTETDE